MQIFDTNALFWTTGSRGSRSYFLAQLVICRSHISVIFSHESDRWTFDNLLHVKIEHFCTNVFIICVLQQLATNIVKLTREAMLKQEDVVTDKNIATDQWTMTSCMYVECIFLESYIRKYKHHIVCNLKIFLIFSITTIFIN